MSVDRMLMDITFDNFDDIPDDDLSSPYGDIKYGLSKSWQVPVRGKLVGELSNLAGKIENTPLRISAKFGVSSIGLLMVNAKIAETVANANLAAEEYYRADLEEDIKTDGAYSRYDRP